eukprot:215708-Chlamydomonas_euryale.AAC.1
MPNGPRPCSFRPRAVSHEAYARESVKEPAERAVAVVKEPSGSAAAALPAAVKAAGRGRTPAGGACQQAHFDLPEAMVPQHFTVKFRPIFHLRTAVFPAQPAGTS